MHESSHALVANITSFLEDPCPCWKYLLPLLGSPHIGPYVARVLMMRIDVYV